MAAKDPSGSRSLAASLVFHGCLAAILLNAVLYTWFYTNPLVSSDAWYFLDVFVRKVVAGDLSFADFFVKRPGVDHAQPLNKLLLYFNVQIAGMDFLYEALAYLACAIGALATIIHVVRTELPETWTRASVRLCLLAIAALLFSLSSTQLYTWSLVTMYYSQHLFAVLLAWFSWRCAHTGRWKALVALGFGVGVSLDDSALIIFGACIGALFFLGLRTGKYRAVLVTAGWLVVSLVASRVLYAFVSVDTPAAVGPGLVERLQILGSMSADFHRWLLIPSTASIVYQDQMVALLPGSWRQWSLAIGLVVLALQVWFWLAIWRARASAIVFLAVLLMLLAYGYWAGIIYGRVPEYGSDYLLQGRYVLFYVLIPVALLLLGIERLGSASDESRARYRTRNALLLSAPLVAILIQVPLSINSWGNAKYLEEYYQKMANQMFALARDPGTVPPHCDPLLAVCGYPPERRAELFQILRQHRLNLFSREFDQRHSMYEGDAN